MADDSFIPVVYNETDPNEITSYQSGIATDPSYVSGSGVGAGDCKAKGIVVRHEYESISSSYILGTNAALPEENRYAITHDARLMVNPGYFYIRDREMYAFGRKVTVAIAPYELAEEDAYISISLPDAPSGYIVGEDGSSPIIIQVFPSGTLGSAGFSYNTTYYSDSVSGSPVLPAYRQYFGFSPVERFAVCHDYRYLNSHIPSDLYWYNPASNVVVISPMLEGMDVLIEYEGSNQAFDSGLSFSPIHRASDTALVCISPNRTPAGTPASCSLSCQCRHLDGGSQLVCATVLTGDRDPVPGVTVNFILSRPGLSDIEYTPYYTNNGIFYDRTETSGAVKEHGLTICDSHRIGSTGLFRGAGVLSNDTVPVLPAGLLTLGSAIGMTISATTDSLGKARIWYHAPCATAGDNIVTIQANIGDIGSALTFFISGKSKTRRWALTSAETYRYRVLDVIQIGNEALIRVPDDALSPTSIEVADVVDYLDSVFDPSTFGYMNMVNLIRIIDNTIYAGYLTGSKPSKLIVKYPVDCGATFLDCGGSYV